VYEEHWLMTLPDVCVPALPVANAGPDQQVPTADVTGAYVRLDGRGSSSPTGATLTYAWTEGGVAVAAGAVTMVRAIVGRHVYVLTVTDSNGSRATDEVEVTVVDAVTLLQEEIARLTAGYTTCSAEARVTETAVEQLTAGFRSAFGDAAFVIPGATVPEQVAALVAAIEKLNHGQRQALFVQLGGKK
jgi:hypothetical protein